MKQVRFEIFLYDPSGYVTIYNNAGESRDVNITNKSGYDSADKIVIFNNYSETFWFEYNTTDNTKVISSEIINTTSIPTTPNISNVYQSPTTELTSNIETQQSNASSLTPNVERGILSDKQDLTGISSTPLSISTTNESLSESINPKILTNEFSGFRVASSSEPPQKSTTSPIEASVIEGLTNEFYSVIISGNITSSLSSLRIIGNELAETKLVDLSNFNNPVDEFSVYFNTEPSRFTLEPQLYDNDTINNVYIQSPVRSTVEQTNITTNSLDLRVKGILKGGSKVKPKLINTDILDITTTTITNYEVLNKTFIDFLQKTVDPRIFALYSADPITVDSSTKTANRNVVVQGSLQNVYSSTNSGFKQFDTGWKISAKNPTNNEEFITSPYLDEKSVEITADTLKLTLFVSKKDKEWIKILQKDAGKVREDSTNKGDMMNADIGSGSNTYTIYPKDIYTPGIRIQDWNVISYNEEAVGRQSQGYDISLKFIKDSIDKPVSDVYKYEDDYKNSRDWEFSLNSHTIYTKNVERPFNISSSRQGLESYRLKLNLNQEQAALFTKQLEKQKGSHFVNNRDGQNYIVDETETKMNVINMIPSQNSNIKSGMYTVFDWSSGVRSGYHSVEMNIEYRKTGTIIYSKTRPKTADVNTFRNSFDTALVRGNRLEIDTSIKQPFSQSRKLGVGNGLYTGKGTFSYNLQKFDMNRGARVANTNVFNSYDADESSLFGSNVYRATDNRTVVLNEEGDIKSDDSFSNTSNILNSNDDFILRGIYPSNTSIFTTTPNRKFYYPDEDGDDYSYRKEFDNYISAIDEFVYIGDKRIVAETSEKEYRAERKWPHIDAIYDNDQFTDPDNERDEIWASNINKIPIQDRNIKSDSNDNYKIELEGFKNYMFYTEGEFDVVLIEFYENYDPFKIGSSYDVLEGPDVFDLQEPDTLGNKLATVRKTFNQTSISIYDKDLERTTVSANTTAFETSLDKQDSYEYNSTITEYNEYFVGLPDIIQLTEKTQAFDSCYSTIVDYDITDEGIYILFDSGYMIASYDGNNIIFDTSTKLEEVVEKKGSEFSRLWIKTYAKAVSGGKSFNSVYVLEDNNLIILGTGVNYYVCDKTQYLENDPYFGSLELTYIGSLNESGYYPKLACGSRSCSLPADGYVFNNPLYTIDRSDIQDIFKIERNKIIIMYEEKFEEAYISSNEFVVISKYNRQNINNTSEKYYYDKNNYKIYIRIDDIGEENEDDDQLIKVVDISNGKPSYNYVDISNEQTVNYVDHIYYDNDDG